MLSWRAQLQQRLAPREDARFRTSLEFTSAALWRPTPGASNRMQYRRPRPFFQGGDADWFYTLIRDEPSESDTRKLIEEQWERFQPYVGDVDHFVANSRKNFSQHLWELRLGCMMLDSGHELVKVKKEGAPDLHWKSPGGPAWIEAIAATGGTGEDAATRFEEGFTCVGPEHHRKILLRHGSAVHTKRNHWAEFIERRVVTESDAYVIAVNGAAIPEHGILDYGPIPGIVKALFGLGEDTYVAQIDMSKGQRSGPIRVEHPPRTEVMKETGPVPMNLFGSGAAPEVSAVLFSGTPPHRFDQSDYGWLHIVHNPFARVPVPAGAFGFGRNWHGDLKTGRLTVPEKPKEDEPAQQITVEDFRRKFIEK